MAAAEGATEAGASVEAGDSGGGASALGSTVTDAAAAGSGSVFGLHFLRSGAPGDAIGAGSLATVAGEAGCSELASGAATSG